VSDISTLKQWAQKAQKVSWTAPTLHISSYEVIFRKTIQDVLSNKKKVAIVLGECFSCNCNATRAIFWNLEKAWSRHRRTPVMILKSRQDASACALFLFKYDTV
jgi:hypothetical protein